MKNYKYILIIVSLMIMIFSCKDSGNNTGELVRIEFLYDDKAITHINSDTIRINTPLDINSNFINNEVFSNYRYILLETSKISLIGEINKIIITDNLIFIGDFKRSKSIFIFDHDGRFKNKINRSGRGPGEYRFRISDFYIDDSLKIITIIDNDRSQIIETDYDGNLIDLSYIKLFGNDLFKYPDDSILYFYVGGRNNKGSLPEYGINSGEYDLLFFNNDKEITNKYFRMNSDFGANRGSLNNFYKHEEQLYFMPVFGNRIFEINTTSINCRYYIDFGASNIDSFYIVPRSEVRGYTEKISNKGIPIIDKYMVDDNFLYLVGTCQRRELKILYSKKTGNSIIGFNIVASTFSGKVVGMHEGNLIMAMDAYQMKLFEPIKDHLGVEEQNIMAKVNTNDNPIIIIGQIRDF